jgi:hypothetical protein
VLTTAWKPINPGVVRKLWMRRVHSCWPFSKQSGHSQDTAEMRKLPIIGQSERRGWSKGLFQVSTRQVEQGCQGAKEFLGSGNPNPMMWPGP